MRFLTALLSLCLLFVHVAIALAGDVHVDGYYRKDGTYVQPHYRSAPDGNPNNNWSTQGNINPYTGQEGTKPRQPEYGGGGYNNDASSTPKDGDDTDSSD
jgi:hypothetical protein